MLFENALYVVVVKTAGCSEGMTGTTYFWWQLMDISPVLFTVSMIGHFYYVLFLFCFGFFSSLLLFLFLLGRYVDKVMARGRA